MADLKNVLKTDKIKDVKLREPLCVQRSASLREALEEMRERRRGYVIVVDKERAVGIFTERDIMVKVVEQKIDLSTPVERLMTPDPKVLKVDDSVADAIRLMNEGGHRHIPLVDGKGKVRGIIGARDIIKYLAEHFPHEVYNLPPDPHQVIRAPEGA